MSPKPPEQDTVTYSHKSIDAKTQIQLTPTTIQVDGNIYDTLKLAHYHPGTIIYSMFIGYGVY